MDRPVGKEDLALLFWAPRTPDPTPSDFSLWEFVKEASSSCTISTNNFGRPKKIVSTVNSVTQDILLRVWNEFSYRLDVTLSAVGGHIEHL